MINKYNDGRLKLTVPVSDIDRSIYLYDDELDEIYYHELMFMEDIYIITVNGYNYILDFNKQLIYDYFTSYMIQNPLKWLLDDIMDNGIIVLEPLSVEESQKLLIQYNNDY